MRNEIRRLQALKRKNYLPTLALTFLLYLAIFGLIYSFDPGSGWPIFVFFVLVFLASLFTFATLLSNTKRGLIIAISLTFFLFLRFFGVGNILNAILVFGIGLSFEIYFSKRR
jgi:hypothetical protein